MRHSMLVLLMFLVIGLTNPRMTGAVEESSTQVGGSVTMADAACSIDVTTSNFDFGEWTWDGAQYQPESQSTSERVNYRVRPPRSGTCQITIETEGLAHASDGPNAVIDPDHFAVGMDGGVSDDTLWIPFTDGSASVPSDTQMNRNHVFIELSSVPTHIPTGEYEGTFIITISAAD